MSTTRSVRLALGATAALALAATMAAAGTVVTGGGAAHLQDAPVPITTLSADIVKQLNIARADPLSEIPKLVPSPYTPAQTKDAADFLRGHAPMPAFIWSDQLTAAAQVQVLDQATADPPGHIGHDGSNPMIRITNQGWHAMLTAEEISVGQTTGADAIRQLIVDIPGPNHPHRYDLFNDPTLKFIGVACGPNRRYGTICVIDMSSDPIGGAPETNTAHAPPAAPTGFTAAEIATGSCWIDAKTGERVPTGPPGWDPNGAPTYRGNGSNPDHDHVELGGHTYVNDPDKGWIDAKTGVTVRTGPPGWDPNGAPTYRGNGSNPDPDHVELSGHTCVRIPCPGG